jgi:multidrug efflux system membrane fusion protein
VDAMGHTRFGSRRRVALSALCLTIVVVAAGFYWYATQGPSPAHAARSPAVPGVPVSIAVAAQQDVPIYLTGLGTVQASFTVGIHSQVDGKLQEVFFTEGQHVKKGDLLAQIDPRLFQAALDQARAKKAQDQALLVSAQKDLERFKSLVLKNIESQQNVDRQQGTVDQLKASLDADAAMIETAQTNLDYASIRAPSDGRIGVRLVDPGNIVHASDQGSIATLVLTQPSAVMFTLPARALDDVRAAMARGPVEVIAFDQDNVRELATGKLLLIDSVIDQSTATIRLKAMFPNGDEKLWPGEFVNARLQLGTYSNAVVVPPAAVQRGPQGLFAWVISGTNTAEARPIELGPTTKDLAVVSSGLHDGDRVVTGGQYKLKRGAPVTIASPPVAASGRSS